MDHHLGAEFIDREQGQVELAPSSPVRLSCHPPMVIAAPAISCPSVAAVPRIPGEVGSRVGETSNQTAELENQRLLVTATHLCKDDSFIGGILAGHGATVLG